MAYGSRRKQRKSGVDEARLPVPGLARISEAVIYPHIFGSADREVGGVLIGRGNEGDPMPLITGAIPAISADEQRSTLTFTQDSWEHVHRVLEREYSADDQIVGWYHSHPGFGIFLSGHDLFIHNNFFTAPFQIAVVVDPIGRTDGTFTWQDGEVSKLYEYPTPEHWQAESESPDVIHRTNAATQGGSGRAAPENRIGRGPGAVLAVILCLFVVAAAFTLLSGGDQAENNPDSAMPPPMGSSQGAGASSVDLAGLTPERVQRLLVRGARAVERRGGSAAAAIWINGWQGPVVVGQLAGQELPTFNLANVDKRNWDPAGAVTFAFLKGFSGSSSDSRVDPFSDWPSASDSFGLRKIQTQRSLTALIGVVPGQFAYFAAYSPRFDEPTGPSAAVPPAAEAADALVAMFTPLTHRLHRSQSRQQAPPTGAVQPTPATTTSRVDTGPE